MFERITHSNGVVFWRSSLLHERGVVHGFSTRHGGVSAAPYDTLNLGNPSDCANPDSNEHLRENYRRLQEAMGASRMQRAWVRQVHGRAVELLEAEPEGEYS